MCMLHHMPTLLSPPLRFPKPVACADHVASIARDSPAPAYLAKTCLFEDTEPEKVETRVSHAKLLQVV